MRDKTAEELRAEYERIEKLAKEDLKALNAGREYPPIFSTLLGNLFGKKKKKKSGFEDDPTPFPCLDPEHEPPSHMVIPQGKVYRHVCPSCGRELIIRPTQVWM